ncbi:MAG: amidohydrolase family protein [Emcibacteraceae bacterium]|nr:amidohydrolase family protein [Emcibacteraceae bacterium]
MQVDLIIRGGMCVSHRGIIQADIAVRDGMIVAIGDFSDLDAENIIIADGLHILPGMIDTEFHVSHQFKNDTRAAAKGGVTSVLCVAGMDVGVGDGYYTDYAYFQQATLDNIDSLAELEMAQGCAGIHLGMAETADFSAIADDRTLLKALKNGSRRIVIHAEDQDRLNLRKKLIKAGNPSSHLEWHDENVAIEATRRILAIARGAGRPVHIQHVSSDKEMAMIAAYKDIATAAVAPAHLFLSAPECYDHFFNYTKLDPPIRDEQNRIGLWKALSGGIVDILASAHSPRSIEQKELNYPHCSSGCPAVQTMLPLMLDQVAKGAISLETIADLTSSGPARIFNIAAKGRIAVGYDADFTIVDLKKKWTFQDDDVESTCGWDLHAGCEFTGQVTNTIIRGHLTFRDGEIIGEAMGKTIKFHDTFKPFDKE